MAVKRVAPKARRGRVKLARQGAPRRPATVSARPTLLYKVVELSQVDEGSLEDTINTWVGQGWSLDGVQFAMRESSKRPAMAFVLFTRAGQPVVEGELEPSPAPYRDMAQAMAHLDRVVREELDPTTTTVHDAWQRLHELASDDGPEDGA